MDKLLDIIIPAYNAHNTIEKTLHSIAAQCSSDIAKVTIVNDASDRDYSEIINKFTDILDIEELTLSERISCGLTRQYGIDHTTLPFIMFMDADDILARYNSIDILMQGFINEDVTVCYGAIQESLFKQNQYRLLSPKHFTWVFGSIMKRSFLEEKEIRFCDTSNAEDTNFNRKIKLLSDDSTIVFLDDVVYIWTDYNSDNRINNEEFIRIDSKVGYIETATMAYEEIEHKVPSEKMKYECISTLLCLCNMYNDMLKINDDEAMEIVMPHIIDYYKSYYKKYENIISNDDIQMVIDLNDFEDLEVGLFNFIEMLEQE